jgi:hypothetical protein
MLRALCSDTEMPNDLEVLLGMVGKRVSMLPSITLQLEHRPSRSRGGKPLFLTTCKV